MQSAANGEKLNFQDIVDVRQLQRLMDLFYKATGIPVGIIDIDGRILVGTGWQDICTEFHRVCPETRARCIESDAYIRSHLFEEKYVQYKCKNGMWDIALPIIVGEQHLATLFVGQFFYADEKPDIEFFRRQAKEFGFDERAYLEALNRTRTFSREQIRDIMAYYAEFVHLLSDLAYNNLLLARDIRIRRQTEKALRQSEEKYRTLVENTPDMIICFDRDCRHLYVSPSVKKIADMPPDQFTGKTPGQLGLPDAYCGFCKQSVKAVFDTASSVEKEFDLETPGGGLSFNWRFFPEPDEKGGVVTVMVIARDVTHRKKMEEERANLHIRLLQTQRLEAIGTLAGGIAHDFNNILSPIIGYAELASDDVTGDSETSAKLSEILTAANRAKKLIQQILTFSRQNVPERRPLKLRSSVLEASKLLRATLPATIEILHHIDDTCRPVMADSTQIHQVIMNLGTNAWHAMRETGGILSFSLNEIRLEGSDDIPGKMAPGDYVRMTVSDTGHGMTPDIAERIFDPYFTTKENGKGTGLGLSVVHGIIKNHGGSITVYSEPGKGTTFNIYIPVITEKYSVIPPRHDSEMEKGCERILIVDDEEQIVRMMRLMLERFGYHVTSHTSSPDAVKCFRARPDQFDLVITDMTMPRMTGDMLARELKAIRPDIPVIICTGFSEQLNEKEAEKMGADYFMMKPVIKNELSRIVRKVLDERR
ncbi:hypothetical protein DENIS_1257 [Desulfonema ishimotonii]|uniref:histidine kinase n=1 Tax=Desulfonema ishimotonii TaxID=45657 RepID=A0A401FTL6_9BACT|nr:PocR ligand-binding domain-containing protein [Desulfonema ishimotonii]GBC60306.1 hypothetical protein DENIS_1257 [Desulfonema ishimotonii]